MTNAQQFDAKITFNPGEIKTVNGWPRWKTRVGSFDLELDIVAAGGEKFGQLLGIASFVVMEQHQALLDYLGGQLAAVIAKAVPSGPLVLLTAETKGSHFVPWVWHHLAAKNGSRLHPRVITLRKGELKAYMQRPARTESQRMLLPWVAYHSITSTKPQHLTMSPRDVELLFRLPKEAAVVFVDDFIGHGGTLAAITHLFVQLNHTPPTTMAVIGTDGDLYLKTLAEENINVNLLRPFPLILPTFRRASTNRPWKVSGQK